MVLILLSPGAGVVVLVPEPVATFQLLELDPDDAGKRGTHQGSL